MQIIYCSIQAECDVNGIATYKRPVVARIACAASLCKALARGLHDLDVARERHQTLLALATPATVN